MAQSAVSNDPQGIVIERVDDSRNIVDPVLYEALAGVSEFRHAQALDMFYAQRDYKGYWTRGDRYKLRRHANDFIEILQQSWTHGLNPRSYHIEEIQALRDADEGRERLEILLSDAYVAYGQDLSGIRVNPAALGSHKRFWQKPLAAEVLLERLRGNDIEEITDSFAPRGATYNALRDALVQLTKEEPETYEAVLPIRVDGLLKPYQEHRAVPDLRIRFGLDGAAGSYVYDDVLAAAVIGFQRENGLKPDAVIGPSTLNIINQTRSHKIRQLIANLERLRWIEEEKPEKFVIVNVPSATLWAVDDGRVEFEMPVIVGRKKRPTNIFVTDITGVRFNPTWTVPPTIKKKDIVPKLIADPNHLMSKGIELTATIDGVPMTLDPTAIDWTTITDEELHTFRMTQVPGAHNPLGQVRVLMPNSYNIYLHDTNERYLFGKDARAVSSGCVRLEEPYKMAEFILRDKKNWSQERQKEVLAGGKIKDVFIRDVIPVYLVYYTVWLNDAGSLVYGNDLYGYDDEVIKMLSNIDGFFIPVDNTERSRGYADRSRLVSVQ